jgi:hypothetical protein
MRCDHCHYKVNQFSKALLFSLIMVCKINCITAIPMRPMLQVVSAVQFSGRNVFKPLLCIQPAYSAIWNWATGTYESEHIYASGKTLYKESLPYFQNKFSETLPDIIIPFQV